MFRREGLWKSRFLKSPGQSNGRARGFRKRHSFDVCVLENASEMALHETPCTDLVLIITHYTDTSICPPAATESTLWTL